jgi:gliding motility-associated-like protein
MQRIKQNIGFVLFLFLFLNNLNAQVDREFWFAIPKETSGHSSITATNNVSFKIAAMSLDAKVTISMPANSAFTTRTFVVPAGQSRIEVLATSFTEFADIYNNNTTTAVDPLSGKTNRGILITADNDITVYYDYDNAQNRDLFSLKGKNGLGTEFYTPFQTLWPNGTTYNPDPYSSIEIVATEDGTEIDVYPTKAIQGFAFPGTIHISLNRGEAYSLRANATTAAGHPTGTRIVSNKKIAVVVNDDSVKGANNSCYDIIGDQLVPTNIIGSRYVVMTGDRQNNVNGAQVKDVGRGEQILVVATKPNTTITFSDKNGVLLYTTVPALGAQGTDYFSVNIGNPMGNADYSSIFVTSNDPAKPFYVFHITGIGCELGGAIVPPITDCTGSSEVSFYRSSTVSNITINLMVPYNTGLPFADASQSHNFFTLYTYNADGTIGSTFPIPGNWFEPNVASGWAVLTLANRNFDTETTSGRAHKITNTQDFFHMGITNGTSGSTNKYGYFSSFNVAQAAVRVSQTEEPDYIGCFGDTITLVASGGLNYTWHYGKPSGPPTFLSDPKSATPEVINAPVGSHNFYVEIQQSKCFGTDTLKISVTILPVVKALFEVDKSAACAPDTIVFTNKSDNADIYTWKKQIGSNPEFDLPLTPPNNPMLFKEYMNNPSITNPLSIKYTLIAESNQGCSDRISKTITVFPRISADFLAPDTVGCNPLPVQFTNTSGGNTDKYYWNFGDQGSSVEVDPLHIYYNFGQKDTTYHVQLVAKSPFFCTDTALTTVRVHPFIEAHYAVDTVRGCSPLQLQIQNASLGAISRYKWDYGITIADTSNRNDVFYNYTYTNTGAANVDRRLKLSVFNAAGCEDTMSRLITIYPEILTDFTAGPLTNGCNPLTVNFTNQSNPAANSFYWDFGDGANSIDKDPLHIFENLSANDTTFKVKLRATTSNHCPGYDSTLITVRAFIAANFTMDNSESCTPFTINLHNESVGGITQYNWDFGDGSPIDNSPGPNISHPYSNTGVTPLIRNITLEVIGSGGCTNNTSRPVTLYPEINADFTPDRIQGCNPMPVTFVNNSTPGVADNFTWTFGDGTSSNNVTPVHVFDHIFSTDQTFSVKLVARSIFNCKDSVTKDITVYSYIDARFTIDNADGCSPLLINISDASVGGITNKVWFTGDNNYFGNITQHTYTNKTNAVQNKGFRLIVSNSHGCQDTLIRPVTIYPEVDARFITNVTQGCNPLTVNYTNMSGPFPVPTRYRWEFGDNSSTGTSNLFVSHSFENLTSTEKVYKTKLYAYSNFNCVDSANLDIRVYPFIKANFGFNNPVGCSPHPVTFTNASWPGANGFTWVYGDGFVERNNAINVSHTFRNLNPTPRIFQPMLIADYNGSCQDTMQLSLEVYPEVRASFMQDTLKGCHPLIINFFNNSMNAHRYNWYFGDKGSSILVNPSHTYSNFSNVDSIYKVRLVASSIFNCTNELTKTVTIYPKPKARFNVENSINCPPFNVPINNLSEAGDSYLWTFGDGTSLANNTLGIISHVYDNYTNDISTFELNLLVETVHNCSDQASQNINVYPRVIADFLPDTMGCSPFLVAFKNNTLRGEKYSWDFGDGSTSKIQEPAHRFFNPSINDTLYTVELIAQSKFNCADTANRNVIVFPQPETRFTALPSHLYFPDAITNIINETNVGYWTFRWDFDDGQTSLLRDPGFHEYNTWGNYNIKLVAQSSNCIDSTTQRVRIFPPMPIPDFEVNNDNGCVPLTVSFTDRSTWANTYYWEFDDGGVSTEVNPLHQYTEAGNYQVKLTVTGDGGTAYIYHDVYVRPKPVVEFELSPKLVMLPNADVNFYNKSKLGTRFLWDFGDETQSSDIEPRHRYEKIGIYTVSLSVWTQYNCFDSTIRENIIKVLGPRDIRFPNAFTPSLSGPSDGTYEEADPSNDIFHPYYQDIGEFKMEIYNRWGEKLFETNNIEIGWNGYYKGELCKADVYVYKVKGKFLDGTPFEMVGDVTLLR